MLNRVAAMTPVEAVRTCLFRKYFDFRGRAPRPEYWWFFLFSVLVERLANQFDIRVVSILLSAGLFLPSMAVAVRRLHDTGRSGWWLLLWAPGRVFALLADYLEWAGWIANLILLVVVSIPGLVFLWFMVQKGDAWENRYGPNPAPDTVLGLTGSAPRSKT